MTDNGVSDNKEQNEGAPRQEEEQRRAEPPAPPRPPIPPEPPHTPQEPQAPHEPEQAYSVLETRPPGAKSAAPQLILWALIILVSLGALIFSLWGLASEMGLTRLPGSFSEISRSISRMFSEPGREAVISEKKKGLTEKLNSLNIMMRLKAAHTALAEKPTDPKARQLVGAVRMEAVDEARRLYLAGNGEKALKLLAEASDMQGGPAYSKRIKLFNLKGSIKKPQGKTPYLIITGQAQNQENREMENICLEAKVTAKDKSILARSWALAGPLPEAGKIQALSPDQLAALLLDPDRGKPVRSMASARFGIIIPDPPENVAAYKVRVFAAK